MDKNVSYAKSFSFTFKGDGMIKDPVDKTNFQVGFDHGYSYAVENCRIGKKFDPFPGNTNKGWFGNGFAEGVISGRHFVLNRDYPNWLSVGYEGGKYGMDWCVITFKNGNWIRIKCD